MTELTDLLPVLFGAITSLLFMFLPKLKDWWAAQEYQRELTLGFFLLAPFAIYGLSCGGLDYKEIICPPDAFRSVQFYYDSLITGFSAFVGSQVAFAGVKRTKKIIA
jgi:hypothetical protein